MKSLKSLPLILFSIVSILLFFVWFYAYGSDDSAGAAVQYNEAGKLYQEGRFQEALHLYEDLVGKGIQNPDIYYNASNAVYRTGGLGKAVLYLERALKLAPSDRDALANHTFLNSIKKDKEPADDNPIVEFMSSRYRAVNLNDALAISGVSFAFMMVAATIGLFVVSWRRKIVIVVAVVFGCAFIASSGMALHKVHSGKTTTEAVIMVDEADAYSGPGEENTKIFTIHEGTKVVIERTQGGWNLVRLKSGAGGWIKSDAMEKI